VTMCGPIALPASISARHAATREKSLPMSWTPVTPDAMNNRELILFVPEVDVHVPQPGDQESSLAVDHASASRCEFRCAPPTRCRSPSITTVICGRAIPAETVDHGDVLKWL